MSKRYNSLPEKTNSLAASVIEKLLPQIKKNCTTKFDESIDLSVQINNKQKKGEVNLRSVVNLPSGTGKRVIVAVVCEDSKAKEANDAGADQVGGDDFIEKNKNVSIVELIIEDVNGAINHSFFLSLSNIWTSNNCAVKNAVPDPIAILIDIKSAKSVENKTVNPIPNKKPK